MVILVADLKATIDTIMTCPRCNSENKPDAPQRDQFCHKCNGPLSEDEVRRIAENRRLWEQQKRDYAAIRGGNNESASVLIFGAFHWNLPTFPRLDF